MAAKRSACLLWDPSSPQRILWDSRMPFTYNPTPFNELKVLLSLLQTVINFSLNGTVFQVVYKEAIRKLVLYRIKVNVVLSF